MTSPGEVFALAVEVHEVDTLVDALRSAAVLDGSAPSDIDVRLVLGRACTTAARTVDQFAVALQLSYAASRGWGPLLDAFGERSASIREIVIVVDACKLLRHEEPELLQELCSMLRSPLRCPGGGWTTVALIDNETAWQRSRFQSAHAAATNLARRYA